MTTTDGYDIAYTVSGQGMPLVCSPLGVFNHVELNWKRPESLQPLLKGLSDRFRLIHFDCRGQGLSTRGLPEDFDWEDAYRDLETLVDRLRLDHFFLLGCSTFTYIAVRYAVEHPERIRALTLLEASPSTRHWQGAYTGALPAENWELFLRSWPAAGLSPSEFETRIETLRQSVTLRDYMVMARTAWDITDLLPELRVPTLIIHPRGQAIFREEHAIAVAAANPNGRLVIIDGGQSVFGDTAAGLRAIDDFFAHLTPDEAPGTLGGSLPNNLSPRETEILRLIAFGRSNQEIADQLVLSIRTVERHIANVYLKTGAHTKAQATAFAHRVGLV